MTTEEIKLVKHYHRLISNIPFPPPTQKKKKNSHIFLPLYCWRQNNNKINAALKKFVRGKFAESEMTIHQLHRGNAKS